MTLWQYWLNVWFSTLGGYCKMQFCDLGQIRFTWGKDWWHFLFIHGFDIWATYVITGWHVTLSAVRYQICRRLTFRIVSIRLWPLIRKLMFAVLPVQLAVSSLSDFRLNDRKIYRTYNVDFELSFDVFHMMWSDSTWSKPNYDLRH